MDRDYEYEDTMPQNRHWYDKPLQGGGRTAWDYGRTNLTTDDPAHVVSRFVGWLTIGAVFAGMIAVLYYIAGHPA